MHTYETRLEDWWQKLPAAKQRKLVILFFAGYLLVTASVILSVWYNAKTDNSRKSTIQHISNPLLQKRKSGLHAEDLSSTPLKNKQYERK